MYPLDFSSEPRGILNASRSNAIPPSFCAAFLMAPMSFSARSEPTTGVPSRITTESSAETYAEVLNLLRRKKGMNGRTERKREGSLTVARDR